MSGETCPGDWANVSANATAPTTSNHVRDNGATRDPGAASACGALVAGLATVAVLDPVEH
ncbi:hypothetical protein MSHI_32410 [Mycobacterium shinjukuense]|uniref:Uncharacterized protein n=1 Tax=Mycobacterium shinjukuense TaxID=398694 RepID=A0A7I7MT22_9MYCO|nr:hypothetical protein MSHI_32410 [Mycobacterium shinjukuense]